MANDDVTTTASATSKAPIGSLRTLWPFVRAHRGLFIAWLLALAASSTATLSLPVAVRRSRCCSW